MSERKKVYEHVSAISWGDMDALGHVNNAKYFDYFQEARILWLSELGIVFSATGPVLAHIDCTYLKPLVYPANILTKVYIHSLGRSSFSVDYDIQCNQMLIAKGTSKIVWVDYKLAKSVPLPKKIIEQFA